MSGGISRWVTVAIVAITGLGGALTVALPSQADSQTYTTLVSDQPAPVTANVLDGVVRQTATVDGITVAVGNFTQVESRGSSTVLTRKTIFAFDSNGQVLSSFQPVVNGKVVYDVISAGDGTSVYIAGDFSSVNGAKRTSKVARIDVHTGAVITAFKSPGFNAPVTDLQLVNGNLWAGGLFTLEGTTPRSLLADLDPTTGADTGAINQTFSGTWNGGKMGITHMTVSPDGRTMVVVGNFTAVNGQSRPQIAMFDLTQSPAVLSTWATQGFAHQCSLHFHTYVNDVDFDPTSTYFVVGTTGAYSGGPSAGSLCDAVSRFETNATGPNQMPTWVHYTGGDTVTQVEATADAIYIGGHFRWLNNPFVGDQPGPGNVKRQGLGALDPRNGQPYTWAPQMRRHWGVFGFRSAPDGLWVMYDSSAMNGQNFQRIAFFPLSSTPVPLEQTGTIPGSIVQLGQPPAAPDTSTVLYRVDAGGPTILATDGGPNWSADNATSTVHNTGSATASWNNTITRSSTLPASTPTGIFNTERYDPAGGNEMSWAFPVTAGTPIQVRLYFANSCSCTASAGQRKFNVTLDGTKVLTNYDIVADTGNKTGTMKAFNETSDGTVNIDFTHAVENPLINGIEIVRTNTTPTPPTPDTYTKVSAFDGSTVTSSSTSSITSQTTDWSQARGAFMVDKTLYTGWSNGTMTRRTWSGAKFGGPTALAANALGSWAADLQSTTSMFYDAATGRIYYTLAGDPTLYYRYFTTQSNIVGAMRFTSPGGSVDWTKASGAFLSGTTLYVTYSDGTLYSVGWQGSSPNGSLTAVSGPGIDGQDWRSDALFLMAG